MAVLSQPDRTAVHRQIADECNRTRAAWPLSRADTQAAVDAADAWIDANAASYNGALPAAARTALTGRQKALMLAKVILKRFEVS